MIPSRTLAAAALLAGALLAPMLHAQKPQPITIAADLTDGPRKLYHAEIDLPVKPGPLTLTTPKWIPGNHRPTGPVDDITGVVFTVNGQPIPWRRDDVDLYQFHLTIPKGVATLHAHLDCIVTERISARMTVLEWEKLLLYPANIPVKDIAVQPSVTVPQGWGIGTALTPIDSYDPQHPTGGTTHYAATTVEQLEDSPSSPASTSMNSLSPPRSSPPTSSMSSRTPPKTPSFAPPSSQRSPISSARPTPTTPPTTTTSTTSCSPSPMLPAAKVSSTASPPTTVSAKRPTPTPSTSSPSPTSWPTSSPTPGTASIAAPSTSTRPTSRKPSKARCSGSTRA